MYKKITLGCNRLMKFNAFFIITSQEKNNVIVINENVIKSCGQSFLLLFITYQSQKKIKQKKNCLVGKGHCWSKRLPNVMQILPNSITCPN